MNDDQTFRAVLLIIVLAVLPVGFYHRLQSQATREKLDRWQEGLFILATLRPLGLLLWLGVVFYLVDPAWMAWSSLPLPAWLRWMGAVVCATGGGLVIWTFRRLGKNLTDTVVTRRVHTLVTHGPYRWVRHPFYDSVMLFILGVALIAANWFLFLLGVMLMGLLVIRTRTEEAKLLDRFGAEYRESTSDGRGGLCPGFDNVGEYRGRRYFRSGPFVIVVAVLPTLLFAAGAAMTYRERGWTWVSAGLACATVFGVVGIVESLVFRVLLAEDALFVTNLLGQRRYPAAEITHVAEGKGMPTTLRLADGRKVRLPPVGHSLGNSIRAWLKHTTKE